MIFTSVLRGYKRRMHERVGVPVPVPVESSSKIKLAFPRVLWCIRAPGQPGISTSK